MLTGDDALIEYAQRIAHLVKEIDMLPTNFKAQLEAFVTHRVWKQPSVKIQSIAQRLDERITEMC